MENEGMAGTAKEPERRLPKDAIATGRREGGKKERKGGGGGRLSLDPAEKRTLFF
jgi:hypothetical protein